MEEFNFKYNVIYFSVFFMSLLIAIKQDVRKNFHPNFNKFLILFFTSLLILLAGLRPIEVGSDTEMYFWQYQNLDELDNREPLYKYFLYFLHFFSDNSQYFFVIFALLFFSLFFYFIINRKNVNSLLLFVFFFSLFSFKSMFINILRQGLSIMFLLNAYNFYCNSKKKKTILFTILSLAFHTTSIIPILLFLISKKIKNYRIGIIILIFGIILAYLDIGLLTLYSKLSFLKGVDVREVYFEDTSADYKIGFRYSFLIFNLIFLFFALMIRKRIEFDFKEKKQYDVLINFYLLASFVFFISFQIPFSDRLGLFSWIVIPLFFEPLIKNNIQSRATISLLLFFSMYMFFEITLTK